MKKFFALLLALTMVLSLAACAQEKNNENDTQSESEVSVSVNQDAVDEMVDQAKNSGGELGYAGNGAASLKTLSEDNFSAVAKEIFGIEISEADGFTLDKVESINQVNDLHVYGKLTDAQGSAEIMKLYFERCLEASGGSVWKQEINWDTFAMTRGAEYTSFDAFYAAESPEYDAAWIYDFGGHGVQFTFYCSNGSLNLSLVLLG